jgi:hypothetical protein
MDAGSSLVSGKLLADISRSLPAKPVDITTDGSKVSVTCGSGRFTLLTMPVEEYPALPVMPEASGTVAGDVFTQAVQQVSIARQPGRDAADPDRHPGRDRGRAAHPAGHRPLPAGDAHPALAPDRPRPEQRGAGSAPAPCPTWPRRSAPVPM